MRDSELYAKLLGLTPPWSVTGVDVEMEGRQVLVHVAHDGKTPSRCPDCNLSCPGYDTRTRSWRHLDTMQYRTILQAEVPRVKCPEHGVVTVKVPWAEPGSRFTAMFECLVIDWLLEANISAVGRLLDLSWDEAAGIRERAVRRGLARRKASCPRFVGVDETSFQKRHEYVTVVSNLDTSTVLYVADGRNAASLQGFYETLDEAQRSSIAAIAMDMAPAYIKATRAAFDDADELIVFDKFHVAKSFGDAVDKVRRTEARELASQGDHRLKRTKYSWLRSWDDRRSSAWRAFEPLRNSNLKVARAWAMKETAASLWYYERRKPAEKAWLRLVGWMQRSQLEPMRRLARTVKKHLHGILNAVESTVTNAGPESINAKVQRIKRQACGFRNRDRFRNAIYFHLGGLDLYPAMS